MLGSTSASLVETIMPLPPDFAIVISPTALMVKSGQSGVASLTLTPLNGFNSTVSLSCFNLPVGTSCAFSSPSVQSDGTWVYMVTVSTTETSASQHRLATLAKCFMLSHRLACFVSSVFAVDSNGSRIWYYSC